MWPFRIFGVIVEFDDEEPVDSVGVGTFWSFGLAASSAGTRDRARDPVSLGARNEVDEACVFRC